MNLASIRRISEIKPIENADSIELASIDGWKVVVKKGEFKEGDVYKSVHKIDGKIFSFKVISNQYLLKVEE